jgi:hypothetical protein
VRARVLAAVTLLVAAGCSNEGSPEALAALPGPGTELRSGFVVPDDAHRVGPVREIDPATRPRPDEGFVVDLALEGDPRAAANDLVRQAVAQGLDAQVNCGRQRNLLACDARGIRAEDGRIYERLGLDVALALEGSVEYRAGGSMVYERWDDGVPDDRGRPPDLSDPPPPVPVGPLPPLAEPPELPGPGDPIEPRDSVGAELLVVDGTEVVVPVEASGCVTGGFVAHLVVTADPAAVIADYESQVEPLVDEIGREDSPDELVVRGIAYGGFDVSISVDRRAEGDDPLWATVRTCND